MKNQKIRTVGVIILLAAWAVLTAVAWFKPAGDISDSERRPLAQFPTVSAETIFGGKFMTDFESYTLDQFPARDTFRKIKSLFHYYGLQQKDNNDIYIQNGYAAKLEFPMKEGAVNNALSRFSYVYETYLKDSGSAVFSTVVPDKGYYLTQSNGYPAMDYEKLFALVQEKMPWATHVDITHCLTAEDYYFTDTHWRQECILPVAQTLSEAMGVTAPKAEDFTQTALDRPFYGVYYGQAALPMEPETMYIMESDLLSGCTVYCEQDGKKTAVYDLEKLTGRDQYDVFLSGSQRLLEIENPNAKTDRELIIFRDSFGSSITPLLVQDYAKVTVVDLRYLPSQMVGQFVDFHGQDVLFLHSTLILNSGYAIK